MTDVIRSVQNPRIKKVRSLKQTKARRKEGQFVIEGQKMVEEALRDCPDAMEELYIAGEWEPDSTVSSVRVSPSVLAAMSSRQEPQGVLAVIRTAKIPFGDSNHKLLLDGVADPGNLGTLVRTAEAFGFTVLLTPDCVDAFNPKAVQASMGSILRQRPRTVQLHEIQAIRNDHRLIGTGLDGSLAGLEWPEKLMLVLGSESHGIRSELHGLLYEKIRIPMQGPTESLNVAVAGGILMHGIAFPVK